MSQEEQNKPPLGQARSIKNSRRLRKHASTFPVFASLLFFVLQLKLGLAQELNHAMGEKESPLIIVHSSRIPFNVL